MEARFKPLDSEFEKNSSVIMLGSARPIYRVDDLLSFFQRALKNMHDSLIGELQNRNKALENWQNWSDQGVDCEVLQPGARGWRKGKMRIKLSLEFCPDEPDIAEIPASKQSEVSKSESPLDDIRRTMNHNS